MLLQLLFFKVSQVRLKFDRIAHTFGGGKIGAEDIGANALLARVRALDIKEHVRILPFQEHEELNALYNAADAAWYPMAAISNFEGLGTGLPILLPDEQNVSHIIQNGIVGSYYTKEQVPELMMNWTNYATLEREQNASNATDQFEYRSIVQKLLDTCASG